MFYSLRTMILKTNILTIFVQQKTKNTMVGSLVVKRCTHINTKKREREMKLENKSMILQIKQEQKAW